MSYHVYILRSLKDGKYYIGNTSDVEARLRSHNAGLQRSTKSRIPFELIYQEACSSPIFHLDLFFVTIFLIKVFSK